MTIDAEPDDIEWLPSMEAEISGFGDDHWSYEQACRDMVIAGATWLAEHPEVEPKFKEMRDAYGVVEAADPDSRELLETMVEAVEDDTPTGAMVHATVQHVVRIHEYGWDEYVELMQEPQEVADGDD